MSPVDLFLYYHFQGMILLCSSRCKCLSSICRDDRGHRTSHRSKNHGVIRNDPKLHCTKVLRRTPCRTHAFSNAHFVAKVRVDPLIEAVGGHRSTLWSKFFRPFLPILSYTCIRAESPRGATDLNVNCTDVRIRGALAYFTAGLRDANRVRSVRFATNWSAPGTLYVTVSSA
jgi:hypothetical protein